MPLKLAVGTHFHARHGTKTTLVFVTADAKKLLVAFSQICLFKISQSSATRKHLFLYPQRDRSGLRKPKIR